MKDTDNRSPSPVREAADRFGTVIRRGTGLFDFFVFAGIK